MSLDDFTTESEPWKQYKKYSLTEKDKKLEAIVDELEDKFPEKLELDFIEASPAMDSNCGWAYQRTEGGAKVRFIRIGEWLVDQGGSRLRSTVLHEMVHIFLYQNGFNNSNPHKPSITDGDPEFHWILGAVGASISGVSTKSDIWKDVCEKFINEGHGLKTNETVGSLVKRSPNQD
jgi:hypothetical protein